VWKTRVWLGQTVEKGQQKYIWLNEAPQGLYVEKNTLGNKKVPKLVRKKKEAPKKKKKKKSTTQVKEQTVKSAEKVERKKGMFFHAGSSRRKKRLRKPSPGAHN